MKRVPDNVNSGRLFLFLNVETMNLLAYVLMLVACISALQCVSTSYEMEMLDVQTQPSAVQPSKFSFASYYGDHMVLQAAPHKAVIWGYAPKGQEKQLVRIVIGKKKYSYVAMVTDDLKWSTSVGGIPVGGPYTITAQLENQTLTLKDVLFGDVWICSGQSNMQFSMSQVFNSTEELKDSVNYPDIRVFTVDDKQSPVPLDDLISVLLPWSRPSPDTLGGGDFRSFSAVCWLYGKYLYQKLRRPLGLVETSWGGTAVESWSSPEVLRKCGIDNLDGISPPSKDFDGFAGGVGNTVLWNAMVHPLLNMTIYGAIWYQGESNAKYNRDKYNCTFPSMIDDWRKKFHAAGGTNQLFPFGFVQLAAYNPDYSVDTGFAAIRWHQTADYGYVPNHRLRNVFMAVAMDLPDFTSPYGAIHPRDKQDVAARLALGGLAVAYGYKVSFQGPYPVKVTLTHVEPYHYTQVNVEYNMNIQQLWLDSFEVCCSFVSPPVCQPGKSWWLPTATLQATNIGNVTESYASECTAENLVGLRYAWRDSPCQLKLCALYGDNNSLPMPPFVYYDEGFKKRLVKTGKYVVTLS